MKAPQGKSTRDRILEHANKLVMHEGTTNFSLADVAKSAGISKGGLLHHFGTKDELIRCMLEEGLHGFRDRFDMVAGEEGAPGGWTRAYVKTSFPEMPVDNLAAPLLASLSNDRSLITRYVDEQDYWSEKINHDGLDPMLAEMIRFAADGLFFNEAIGLSPLSPEKKTKFLNYLLHLTVVESV